MRGSEAGTEAHLEVPPFACGRLVLADSQLGPPLGLGLLGFLMASGTVSQGKHPQRKRAWPRGLFGASTLREKESKIEALVP